MNGNFLEQFAATWNIFLVKKFPRLVRDTEEGPYDHGEIPELTRPMTPLVGALLGLLIYLPSWVLLKIFGTYPAAIAGGLLAPLFLEYLGGWRGLNALASYINMRRNGFSQEESISNEPESIEESMPPASTITVITIYLLRVAMFGALIACHQPFWFIVALTGAYLVRAEMTTVVAPGTDAPLINAPEKAAKWHWYVASAIMLLVALPHFWHIPMALLAIALAWGLAWYATGLCLEAISGMTDNAVEIFGYASELALFLLGILFLTGR